MDFLLSYDDIILIQPINICKCKCTSEEYKCYKKSDFINCMYKNNIINKCPYINILLDDSLKYDLIEKPTDYSLCDSPKEFAAILNFLTKLTYKQSDYHEFSKTVGVICVFYVILTNLKYNIFKSPMLYNKIDLIIENQEEYATYNSNSNNYSMTKNFNKYSINEFIEIIKKWKEYI